ncbi:hypothetical protein SAMN04487925_103966 [Bradyrhizobium sp. cf659]|nr:hypothetical protein SAMN04487925_103966 [Bradyrhizobium sp. cf659]
MWAWSSVALYLLSFAWSLLGFNSTTIAFATLLATSLAAISLTRWSGEHGHPAAYLAEAQKLGQAGSFGWNVVTGELFWSDETFRIFDLAPTSRPSLAVVLKRTHPCCCWGVFLSFPLPWIACANEDDVGFAIGSC